MRRVNLKYSRRMATLVILCAILVLQSLGYMKDGSVTAGTLILTVTIILFIVGSILATVVYRRDKAQETEIHEMTEEWKKLEADLESDPGYTHNGPD